MKNPECYGACRACTVLVAKPTCGTLFAMVVYYQKNDGCWPWRAIRRWNNLTRVERIYICS